MRVRPAVDADLAALKELDALCFPGDAVREPAIDGELEQGVKSGGLTVVVAGEAVVGYIHVERPSERHAYISSLAIHPGHRGQRMAARLLDEALNEHAGQAIAAVVSPRNLAMLGLLFSRGFLARRFMPDYYGQGKDRVYCQFTSRRPYIHPDDCYIVPSRAWSQVESLLEVENHALTAILQLPDGPAYEVSRFESEDFASLQSDETSVGVEFSSGILAAITFVLGFSFVSGRFPDGVRVLLVGAALATTLSLIVYANTSGELARLRSNAFGSSMKWGNSLSEFGGVLPFLISLPVTFGQVTSVFLAAFLASLVFSAAMVLYDLSHFSISSRFRRTPFTYALGMVVSTAPTTGVMAVRLPAATWIWVGVVGAALIAQGAYYVLRQPLEAREEQPFRRWQARR